MTGLFDISRGWSRRTFLVRTSAFIAAAGGALATGRLLSVARAAEIENVRVSHDAYTVHAEPYLAVNPLRPNNLLAASQVWSGPGPGVIATYTSFDRGASWISAGTLPLPIGAVTANDVTIAFDQDGRGYVSAMATSMRSPDDRGLYLWRTEDGGRTFVGPTVVVAGDFVDHPWLAAAPGDQVSTLHAVWVADDHAALGYSRSRGGADFEAPRRIQAAGDAVSAPVVATAQDRVYAIYVATAAGGADESDASTAATIGGLQPPPSSIKVVYSPDGGDSFGVPIEIGAGPSVLFAAGALLPCLPALAAGPHDGSVYAAFVSVRPGASHADIMLATSWDGGVTWSQPFTVTPADQAIYYQPQLAIDEAGRLAVTAFAVAGGRVDLVMWVSQPHSLQMSPMRRITTRSFDPTNGAPRIGKHGAWWIGDYQALAATPDAFHPCWNDTRTGELQLFTATVRPEEM